MLCNREGGGEMVKYLRRQNEGVSKCLRMSTGREGGVSSKVYVDKKGFEVQIKTIFKSFGNCNHLHLS